MTQDWVEKLVNVTNSLNQTPIKKLGFLKPNDIISEESSVFVDEEKKRHHIEILKEPTYKEQIQNTDAYNGDLKVLDYVYSDFDAKLFDKSFDVSVKYEVCLK